MAVGAPAYGPPPPLPTRPPAAASSGYGLTVLVLVLVVAAAAGYYYYTQVLHKSLGGGSSSSGGAAGAPPPPPPTAAEQKAQMAVCKAKGIVHGTCELDAAAGAVYARCDDQWYGPACTRKCPTSPGKAVVYTPGYEGGPSGSPNAATCACPSTSHFQNSDVATGCRLGDASGDDNCEAGWHGEKCDQQGDYKNCQHGTLNSDGSCSPCDAGFQGSLCQFPSDWCTKIDKGATLDATNDTCTCSTDSATGNPMYTSASRCQQAASGFIVSTDGGVTKARPWTEVWTDMSTAQVTFNGASSTAGMKWANVGCSSSDNCTQQVGICSLLASNSGGDKGCSTIESLCENQQVAVADGRCSLMQKATLDKGMGSPWFESVQVPENVTFGVWKTEGDSCSGTVRRTVSACNEDTCTYNSPTYQDSLAFQFKLPAGHYAKCNNTYYVGPTSSDSDAAPTSIPGTTIVST